VNASLGQPAVPGEPGGPQYSRRGLLEAAMRKARDPQTRQWLSDFLIRGGQQYSEDEQRRLLNEIYYTPQQRGGAYGAVGPDPLRRLTELSAIASRPL